MKRTPWYGRVWAKHWSRLALAVLLCGSMLGASIRPTLATSDQPAWANPSVTAMRRISSIGSAQNTPNFLNNLDCTLTTYRLVGSSTMQTGCFTPTAFGLLDSDSDTAIFNGSD